MKKYTQLPRVLLLTTLMSGFIGCQGTDDESFLAVIEYDDSFNDFQIALRSNGSVATIDQSENQENSTDFDLTPPRDLQNVIDVETLNNMMIALHSDGTVTTWGGESYTSANPNELTNVKSINSAYAIFTALHNDNSLTQISGDTTIHLPPFEVPIASAKGLYFLTEQGSLYSYATPPEHIEQPIKRLDNVKDFASAANIAIMNDGSLQIFDSPELAQDTSFNALHQYNDYVKIEAIDYARFVFVIALRENGTVVTASTGWGSSCIAPPSIDKLVDVFLGDLDSFSALTSEGKIIGWRCSDTETTTLELNTH